MHIPTHVVCAGIKNNNNKDVSFEENFMAGGSCNKDSAKSDTDGPQMQHLNLWRRTRTSESSQGAQQKSAPILGCTVQQCPGVGQKRNIILPRCNLLPTRSSP